MRGKPNASVVTFMPMLFRIDPPGAVIDVPLGPS
ncbi:Uncharacterised protein [Mycobacteroides abscessus subsp. abscessus]|nr:Uncharacterised protein [Mycobacteroides abscessus subsp. abscessus]